MCSLQWLLNGHRPSVWRTPRFRNSVPVSCWWKTGQSKTTKALKADKYWLGYPLGLLDRPVAGRYFFNLLEGKVTRPPSFIGRAAARTHPLSLAPLPGYPLSRKAVICGTPGVGTHSFIAPPNNWQSDRALDLCVPKGTDVLAVAPGVICSACGFGRFPVSLGSRFAGIRLDLTTAHDDIYYAHLERVDVRQGQGVGAAHVLGLSGVANGVQHLHIACRVCNPYTLAR